MRFVLYFSWAIVLCARPTTSRTRSARSDIAGLAKVARLPTRRYRHRKLWAPYSWAYSIPLVYHISYIIYRNSCQCNRISFLLLSQVGSLASKPKRDLLMMDFWEIESITFPPEGSSLTPAHHYSEFRYKIYAPIAFRYFRDLFGIQPDDFMVGTR